ncbi:Nucleoid occlusion protein [subsurface metagenome]
MVEVKDILIGKIKVGEHVQRLVIDDEEISELAASIGRIGIVNPLMVSECADGFVLVAGHRRLQAAKKLGLGTVPCIIASAEGSVDTEVSFAENLFRKDLSPLELACAVKDVLDKKVMTVEELAAGLHRSIEWLRRMVAMLDWPEDVLEAVHAGWLSIAAAHNVALITEETYRKFLLRNAEDSGATARVTAAWLQAWRSMAPADQAITASPVSGESRITPMVPQAPCICCSEVFRTDELSHVPVCAGCIRAIRSIGVRGT